VRDIVVILLLVVGFATFVTAHVALAFRLVRRVRPRWRGFAAFFVPPLAPLWGFREGLRRNASIWLLSLAVYVVALLVGKLGG
jgi:hypothetical protein